MSKFNFTEDMSEISGFGGEYETACRLMVVAGMEWLDTHPNAIPVFGGMKRGTVSNTDADALEAAMAEGCKKGFPKDPGKQDPSGAMMNASIGHVMYAFKHGGWENYVVESRRRKLDALGGCLGRCGLTGE